MGAIITKRNTTHMPDKCPRTIVAILCCAFSIISCTHQVQTAAQSASHPTVTAVMTRQVEHAVDAGDGDPEIRALRKRLAANARDIDARILLARLYYRRGLPDLALEHYRLAAALFPDSVTVVLELSKTLRSMGQGEQALKTIQGFLIKNPGGNWELLSLEGILDDEQGQLVDAEKAYRSAIALDPKRSSAHNNLGYNLLLQGQPAAAEAEFRRALEIDPHSQIAHNNLGAALAAQSQPATKEALLEWQRTGDPAIAHNNLAAVLIEQGRFADARAELATALQLRPNFSAALANLKLVSEKDGQPATVPAPPQSVTWLRQLASRLGKLTGTKSSANAPSAAPAETLSATTPAAGAEQANTSPAQDEAGKGGKNNY